MPKQYSGLSDLRMILLYFLEGNYPILKQNHLNRNEKSLPSCLIMFQICPKWDICKLVILKWDQKRYTPPPFLIVETKTSPGSNHMLPWDSENLHFSGKISGKILTVEEFSFHPFRKSRDFAPQVEDRAGSRHPGYASNRTRHAMVPKVEPPGGAG